MSLLPAPSAAPQIESPQSPPTPGIASPSALAAPASQTGTSSRYIPEPPRQPSRFWRAVKWPLRQFFKAIILTGRAARAHKAIVLVLLALIVLVGGGTFGLYRVTHPASGLLGGQSAAPPGRPIPNTPFTVTLSGAPSYPAQAVVNGLYAFKSYDASRLWNSFSASFKQYSTQTGNTEQAYQQSLDGFKAQGIVFDDFVVTGEYLGPDGYAYYTVEVIYHQGQQGALATLYFALDPTGSISNFQFLHEQPVPSSSGQ